MLYYALLFLILALIAAAFGFGGIAAVSVSIAKALFFLFMGLFVAAILYHMLRGPASPPEEHIH